MFKRFKGFLSALTRYCFNMKSTIEGRSVRQKMTTSDLKTVENACDEALRYGTIQAKLLRGSLLDEQLTIKITLLKH